jgi:predicted transposase YdaD
MKTDTIFYQLFQSFPSIFFELIQLPTSEANNYRFDPVEVKQLSFRLDGVFLPQNNHPRFHHKTGVGTGIKLSPHPTLLTNDLRNRHHYPSAVGN